MNAKEFKKWSFEDQIEALCKLNLQEFVNFCTSNDLSDLLYSEYSKLRLREINWIDSEMCNFLFSKYPLISSENMIPALKYYAKRLEKMEKRLEEPSFDEISLLIYEPLSGSAIDLYPFAYSMVADFSNKLINVTEEMNADPKCSMVKSIIHSAQPLPPPGERSDLERRMKLEKIADSVNNANVVIYCVDEEFLESDTSHLEAVFQSLTKDHCFILAILSDYNVGTTLKLLRDVHQRLRRLKTKIFDFTDRWILWYVRCNIYDKTALNVDELKYLLMDYK